MLDDYRPRQRGHEWVLPFVERVGPQRRHEEVVREVAARVDHLDLDCSGRPGPLADRLVLAVRELTDVDRAGDDLDAPLLPQPADGDGGVESARIGHWSHPLRLRLCSPNL